MEAQEAQIALAAEEVADRRKLALGTSVIVAAVLVALAWERR